MWVKDILKRILWESKVAFDQELQYREKAAQLSISKIMFIAASVGSLRGWQEQREIKYRS